MAKDTLQLGTVVSPGSMRSASRRRALMIACAVGVIALGAWMEARRVPAIVTGTQVLFEDPDDFLRIVRVRIIGQTWRPVGRMSEINHPIGAELHWTAPVDYLLLLLAKLLGPLTSHPDPEAWAACFVPLILGAGYVAAMMMLVHRAIGAPGAVIAGVATVLSTGFHRAFQFGRADHHAVLELLYLVCLLLLMPERRRERDDWIPTVRATSGSGIFMGIAVWIAAQSMLFYGLIYIGLWQTARSSRLEAREAMQRRLHVWSLFVAGAATLGYLVEYGGSSRLHADQLSLAHLGVLWTAYLATTMGRSRSTRGLLAPGRAMILMLVALGLLLRDRLFEYVSRPEFFRWSALIAELRPLVVRTADDWSLVPLHRALGWVPYVLPIAMYGFWRCRAAPGHVRVSLLLLAGIVTAMAIYQRRWLDHSSLAIVPVLTIGAWELAGLVRREAERGRVALRAAICAAAIGAVMFPSIRGVIAAPPGEPSLPVRRTAVVAERIREYEARHPDANDRRAILCEEGEGPMLVYQTGLPVVAAPYHRAMEGIVEAARFFAERDPMAARAQLDRLTVRYIVVPFRAHEQLANFEQIAFGELRSLDPPIERIDEDGRIRIEQRYRPEAAQTMAYRLAMEKGRGIPGIELIAEAREGAPTADGMSGLVYVVHDLAKATNPGPRERLEPADGVDPAERVDPNPNAR